MAHNAQETEQDDGLAQQLEALNEVRGLSDDLFPLDGCYQQQEGGQDADDAIHREQHPPAQTEGGHGRRGAPHGDVRGQERSDGLHELAKGHGAGQLVALNYVGNERVQRGLHESIADTQQGEGHQHEAVGFPEKGQQQGDDRDYQAQEHGVLAADLVHQHSRGDGENEEPEENEGREYIGGSIRELEICLYVVGGDAHEVHEPHGEEAEHHRNQL